MANLARKKRRKIFDLVPTHRTTVLLSSMGRSGSTWVSNIINYRNEYRYIFEPFVAVNVPEAAPFKYHQYMRPTANDAEKVRAAKAILTGRLAQNAWAEMGNKRHIAFRRLVKDVRTNLMLKWMHTNFSGMPIVLLFRHPCAVANSWLQLGWGDDLSICLAQKDLVDDFLQPFVQQMEAVTDPFERRIFLWCVMYYVPLRQFCQGDVHLAFYENFCVNSSEEVARLFTFLGKKADESVFEQLRRPSVQVREKSDIVTGDNLVNGWRKHVTPEQTKRAVEILRLFGLDSIYDEGAMPDIGNAVGFMQENH